MQDMYLKDGRNFLYVGDVGRKLVINLPNLNIIRVCYETKEGFTKDVKVENLGEVLYADIPDLFLSGEYSALTCYAIATDGEYAYTASEAHFEIKDRQKSEGYSPTDQQLITWDYIETKALEYMNLTEVYMGQAGDSADNAESSAESALQSKNASIQSESNAKLSETNAKASETAANQSETNARASEVAAKQSEDNAQASADNAESSAEFALQSKNASAQSEANAKLSETNAKASETAAKQTLAEAQQIVAGKADKTYVDSNLATKADKSELAVERARIDSLSTLPEGSTTGDAELIGIRIGADGVTYPNAGEAVRAQILNEKTSRETAVNELKGDLDTERNARIESDTALSTRLQKVEVASSVNRYEIDNLKAKAEGKLYRTETVEAEAYTVDVPSSVAPYAELQKIGGKSVVWNQGISNYLPTSLTNYLVDSGTLTYDSDNNCLVHTFGSLINNGIEMRLKYITLFTKGTYKSYCRIFALCEKETEFMYTNYSNERVKVKPNVWTPIDYIMENPSDTITSIVTPRALDGGYASGDKIKYKWLTNINLTKMFGVGNEPTLEECKKIFTADYYPYDAGTLKSFPVKTVKSVGKNLFPVLTTEKLTLLNKPNGGTRYVYVFDVKEPPYVIKSYSDTVDINSFVGKVDDTNTYQLHSNLRLTTGGKYTAKITSEGKYCIYVGGDTASNCLKLNEQKIQIEKGSVATDYVPYREPIMLDVSSVTLDFKSAGSVHDEWSNGKKIKRVGERAYTSGDESDSSVITDGTTTYYPLATPTEETVSEIDNYLEVEGGGTLTFESDDAVHMPVPSTDRFVVDLTSTTEETT